MPAPTGWGVPAPGDRSARDTHSYPHLHASDIEEDEHQVHVPVPTAPDLGAVALVRLVGSVYQWVKTHLSGAITVDADGVVSIDSGDATDGQVLTADGAGAAAWEDLPALADHDHSGDAGDGGTFDAANLESGVATDGQVLTADGVGGAAWEDPTGGGGALDDLTDVNAPSPTDGQVLTWDDGASEWVADDPPAGGVVDAGDVTYTPTTATDWDGDADPGNVDGALDQLAERVDDLEAGGGGGGDSTYTAAYASRPAASNDGDLFLPSDGFTIERDTGAAWAPWGPIFPMTPPVAGDFAWVNQGTATIDTTSGGIYMEDVGAAGDVWRILKKAAPATPYSVTIAYIPFLLNRDHVTASFIWRESASGKMKCWGIKGMGDILLTAYNSPTSYDSTTYVTSHQHRYGPCLFLKARDDGTNRHVYYSHDGQHWIWMHTEARNSFIVADEIGFGIMTLDQTSAARRNVGMLLLSWREE